jgi:hypothetical protein
MDGHKGYGSKLQRDAAGFKNLGRTFFNQIF